jgi:hypothetical protein
MSHRFVFRADLYFAMDDIQHPHHHPLFFIVIPHLHDLLEFAVISGLPQHVQKRQRNRGVAEEN